MNISGRLEGPTSMSRPLVEWRRRPFRYAAIVCSIAVIALLMSGQGTESLLAITAGLIVLVVCWSLVLTRSASDTVILVGTGPELAIVAGILEGERQPLDRIFRASSIDMAADLATHHRCAAVIAALPNLPQKLELVDRTGQAVPIKPASEALAQMLRRIPLDIAAADPNFARSIETSRSQGYLIAKAIVERTIAALILAVLALPAAICAGALLVESRRSLITPIPYIGLRGRPFPMRRFRTKTDGGARSTRLGHVLTRTHAELVPSLLDVIRGDLALIGPGPIANKRQLLSAKRCLCMTCEQLPNLVSRVGPRFGSVIPTPFAILVSPLNMTCSTRNMRHCASTSRSSPGRCGS